MGYQKDTIDNTKCSRRFHITFDPDAAAVPRTEVKCSYCGHVVFTADNHPPAKLAREENLIKTSSLSDTILIECEFQDSFGKRTIPRD